MAQIVTQLSGKLTAVELIADEGGKPSARLRLERTDGRSTVPARAGHALALAVHLKVPLLVAEALLVTDRARPRPRVDAEATAKAGAPVPETDAVKDAPAPVEIPEAFRRAFDE